GVRVREDRARVAPSPPFDGTEPATRGASNLVESFGELSLVAARGKPLADPLRLDLGVVGYRGTSGSGFAWNASGLWRLSAGVAARGMYATTFRTPSTAELFQRRDDALIALRDPCDTLPPGQTTPITLDPRTAAECMREGVPSGSQ